MMRLAGVMAAGLSCLATCMSISISAKAGSITQPGETIGIATGAVLPEGVYFLDHPNYGNDRGLSYGSTLAVNTPVFVWATPWTLGPAHVEFLFAPPAVMVQDPHTNTNIAAIYNPFFSVNLSFDIGNGFNFKNFEGFYAPINNSLNQDFFTYNNRNALTWVKDGWTATAYTVIGITANGVDTGLKQAPNYFNYDLTLQKAFGKWFLGVGGYGSFDWSGISAAGYKKQSQFAVGPLVGYDFDRFLAQVYVTRDIATSNYFNAAGQKTYETRFWTRITFPLWTAPKAATIAARY